MSYINDALKKAQHEKDSRYIDFGGILRQDSAGKLKGRGRWILSSLAIILVLMAAITALILALPNGSKHALSVTSTGKEDERKAVGPAAPVLQVAVGEHRQEGMPETVRVKPVSAPEPKGLESPPKSPQAGPGTEGLYESALKLQRAARNTDAATLYKRVLLLEPGHVKALNNLGVILMGQRRRGQAAEMFAKAIALRGDYIDPYYNLACLYAQAGDHAQSLRYLKAALAISREVRQWAAADADLKPLQALPEYRKMMEEKQ